jgi:putative membrane protein
VPSTLELMLPWQLSPTVMVAIGLAAALYARGVAGCAAPVPVGRRVAFFAGLALIYAALQTSWDYFAGHMFFVLQLQHFALHDLGPALLAVAAPGATLAGGLPRGLRARLPSIARLTQAPRRLLCEPRLATTLYVLSQLLWLLPPVAFDVMVSNPLYRLMSWCTVLGGLPFWHLILDPRSHPLARLRLRQRFLYLFLGMLPMMLTSAALGFSQSDWYPVYAVCGRFLPISPVMDQELGGMAMWVPGGLLVAVVFLFVLGRKLDQAARHATPRSTAPTVR